MWGGGGISLWNKCFSLVHLGHNYWHPIIAMSCSQDNSSEFSPIMPDEVREHLIGDQRPFLHPESLQILQIHSFFSSVHLTHFLQGSGQRTGRPKLGFVLSDTFLFWVWCLFWIIVLMEDPTTAYYEISSMDSFSFFICWYLIESMMPCIWTRCSGPPAEK